MGHANASALGTLVDRTTRFTLLVPLKAKDATTVRRPSLSGANLLIAGTASVIGHISAHIGKPQKQTLEILHNLTTLIAHTEQLHGADQKRWNGHAPFKINIRHPEHVAAVRNILQERLPSHSQVLYLQGEMCRSELLLEIEGVLGQKSSIDVNQPVVSQHEPDRFKKA